MQIQHFFDEPTCTLSYVVYDAQSRALAAHAALETAITQLWFATGTVLDRTGIGFK